jgi:hypothetical protein
LKRTKVTALLLFLVPLLGLPIWAIASRSVTVAAGALGTCALIALLLAVASDHDDGPIFTLGMLCGAAVTLPAALLWLV